MLIPTIDLITVSDIWSTTIQDRLLYHTILIKEKRKHLSKMSDMVSKMFDAQTLKGCGLEKIFIEVYIDNRSVFVIVYLK